MKVYKYLSAIASRYIIPDRYHNSFYLANASLFQIVNYYACTAFSVVFPELVESVAKERNVGVEEASDIIRDAIKKLEYCDALVDVRYPLKRSHGSCDIVRGMRAYHGLSLFKEAIGGFRIQDGLTRHQAQGLAVLSTYRNTCFGIDCAGSHGGLKVNTDLLNDEELRDMLQEFPRKLISGINDIIEPDIGCGHAEMDVLDEVTDKSNIVIMKNQESIQAASKAVLTMIQLFLENKDVRDNVGLDGDLRNKTYIIQGLGKLGSGIAGMLSSAGAICVGVREHDCVISDQSGISIKKLLKHMKKFGTIRNFSQKAREPDDGIFGEQCQILILAATDKALTCHIAEKVKANVVVEACNGPIFPTADKILLAKGKLIIPSILAGGAHTLHSFLSYGNQISNAKDDLSKIMDQTLDITVKKILENEKHYHLNLNIRVAAYIKSIHKIFDRFREMEGLQKREKLSDVQ